MKAGAMTMVRLMAKKTIEKFYSDLSGEELDESATPTTFTFDGTSYEIDLTDAERAAFEKALDPYIQVARRAALRATRQSRTSSTHDPKAVRAWAQDAGIDVPARGRIPASVLDQYRAAQ